MPAASRKRDPLDAARALRFLTELGANNDRAWFGEHRDVWDEHVKPEWEDLVTGLVATAAAFDERYAYLDPRTCIFRLHRDTRFSKDKRPYKDWIAAWLSPRGKGGDNPGFYVQLSPGETLVAAGIYMPEKAALAALRRHFAEDDLRAFDRLLRSAKLAPYLPLETEPLRLTPRGFPKDHPRGELIRARRYIARRTYPDKQIVRDGAFATFRAALRDLAPFVAYLERITARERAEELDGDGEAF